jgi:hypothetical protein
LVSHETIIQEEWKIKDFGGKAVDQVCGGEESFIPKFKGHMCMSKQR